MEKITIGTPPIMIKKPRVKRHKSIHYWRKKDYKYTKQITQTLSICLQLSVYLSPQPSSRNWSDWCWIHNIHCRINDCTQHQTPLITLCLNLRIPPKKNTLKDEHSNSLMCAYQNMSLILTQIIKENSQKTPKENLRRP